MIIPINAEDIRDSWPIIDHYIASACRHTHGTVDVHDIKRHCLSKEMQLFGIFEDKSVVGAMITEVINYPRKRVLRVILLGGNGWDSWGAEVCNVLDNFALHVGAKLIEFQGRRGWLKKLAKFGYGAEQTIYYRTLGE